MFTGIVEEIGIVRSVTRGGDRARIEIASSVAVEGTRLGDSIAVDGACQTVVALSPASFTVEALAETLRKTTLGSLRAGSRVHLERALSLSARLGGHLVQGHVNGKGTVRELRRAGENVYLSIALSPKLERYCIAEGSIAVDGVSLTICALGPGWVEVNLIPHTAASTLLGEKKRGGEVNIENDPIAKYVERLLSFGTPPAASPHGEPPDGAASLERLLSTAF